MALPLDILSNLRGYTKAMYSTWFYYRPAHILFDAGEGVAAQLGNFVYGIERIFLSHGHYDHVGGIPGLILARNAAMGEREKPLEIYHPAGDSLVQLEKEYASLLARHLEYSLKWTPLRGGDVVPLGAAGGKWSMQAYETKHARASLTLGFNLLETRRRLKPELEGRPEKEIAAVARDRGRDAVTEEYDQILLSYSGDSAAVDPDKISGASVLLHEATFLDPEERRAMLHPTLEEVLEVAIAAKVEGLGIFHVSSRYTRADLEARVTGAVKKSGLQVPVILFHQHRQYRIR
ncbi:MAG: MBL fold metallo-hydrolase [Planctomycetota bacterium]|jgi:ribonuclease Z